MGRVMGCEIGHEVHHGVQATMMQVREVQEYGRGTRTVTQPLLQVERPRSTTQFGTATILVFPSCSC